MTPSTQVLLDALRKIASDYRCNEPELYDLAKQALAAYEAAAKVEGPQSVGFTREKDLALIAEMLAQNGMSWEATVRAAVRLYQLIHKGAREGAQFSLTKDGKPWPDTGQKAQPPAFDEAKEREAAKQYYCVMHLRGDLYDFIEGWLAARRQENKQ